MANPWCGLCVGLGRDTARVDVCCGGPQYDLYINAWVKHRAELPTYDYDNNILASKPYPNSSHQGEYDGNHCRRDLC